MYHYTLSFLLFSIWQMPQASAQELTPIDRSLEGAGFEEIDRDAGVKVYKDPESKLIRVAAEGVVAAPPEQVLQALLDYEGQVGMIARVSKTRVLRRESNRIFVYQRLNLPVISDRDYTLSVSWGNSDRILWIKFCASDLGPAETEGVVRVTRHTGSWQLKPLLNGRYTAARFQVRIDLSGSLPRWLARSGAGDELPELFQSIRRMVLLRKKEGVTCYSESC